MSKAPYQRRIMVNPAGNELFRTNAILWGRAKQYYVGEFPGPLSIKSVTKGRAVWDTSEARRVVEGSNYLVLNAGRPYSITIDATEIVETFCLFFRAGFVEEVRRVEREKPKSLLDEPERVEVAEFYETLQRQDEQVSPILGRMHAAVAQKNAPDAWLEDQFFALAKALVRTQHKVRMGAQRVFAKKASTREELYRRLLRGKDYMDSYYDGDLRLEEIARAASVSPYHFHRLFHGVFGETPNEYLQQKRLSRARELLRNSEQSVMEVSLAVGFESSTSFSALFRRAYGCSPREYRAAPQVHKK